MNQSQGELFTDEFQKHLKEQFYFADEDPQFGPRLFFENSGGSLRLKSAVEAKCLTEQFPDCPERIHERAMILKEMVSGGTEDILRIVFGAKSGALLTELTASQTMFNLVGAIMENVTTGTNAVTSSLEHPSAHDAVEYYCRKTGRDFRVVPANQATGGIDPEEVMKYVDKDTVLLSIMSASNISGNIMDIKEIARRAREINPDIYIVTDAVQHAPHAAMDVEDLGIDGMNFAPYKFFGIRGCGFAYVSDRVASMRHRKLTGKGPTEWSLGTPTPGNFAAMRAVISYVCSIGAHFMDSQDKRTLFVEGMNRIHIHEKALLHRLLEGSKTQPGLRSIPGVQVYVDTKDLAAKDLIVAMGIQGMDFTESVKEYQKRGVTVYERINSSIYSKRIVEALGLEGAIRVSPLHCHGKDDIDRFLKITQEIAEQFAE